MIALAKPFDILGEKILSDTAVGGGCIADSRIITSESKNKFFVKSYSNSGGILRNEANGLREIAKSGAIKVPEVVHFDSDVLVLEYISEGKKAPDFFQKFGRSFARMHRYTVDKFGFFENNFIGATEQRNLPQSENWTEFYWMNRLEFQFKLAMKNGYGNTEFRRLASLLESRIHEIIPNDGEKPSLLHGDLWGGNYMVGSNGEAVLIDPAVYYGNREADLAMTKLFGGFSQDFYEAYNDEFPLAPGWWEREAIYKLYHVLNHLNLFGTGYFGQAVNIMRSYS